MVEELLILSYANQETPGSLNYKTTLDRWGYKYKFVGDGEVWKSFVESKLTGYYEYLKTLDKNIIVCVTDAYDVLACGPPEELLKKFKQFNSNIVSGAEFNCGGVCISLDNSYWVNKKLPKNRYCNSGFFMGYAHSLLEMCESMLNYNTEDDQIALGKYITEHPDKVKLDVNHNLVANVTFKPWEFKVIDCGRVKYENYYPCFLHVPGSNGDIFFRYIYFAKNILKESFVNIPIKDRFQKKYNLHNIIIGFLLLFVICKPLFALCFICVLIYLKITM